MSTGEIRIHAADSDFDSGPYVAGIIIGAIGFVLLFFAFSLVLHLNERHAIKVDRGELIDAGNIASVRRQRDKNEGSDEEDEEGDEEDSEEYEEDDGAAAA